MKLRDSTFKLFSINRKGTEPEKKTHKSVEHSSHDDFSCVCLEEEALTAAECEEILVKGSSFYLRCFYSPPLWPVSSRSRRYQQDLMLSACVEMLNWPPCLDTRGHNLRWRPLITGFARCNNESIAMWTLFLNLSAHHIVTQSLQEGAAYVEMGKYT